MDFKYGIAGGGALSGMFDSFMHPERGYQKAAEQEQQYYKDAQGNLQPYNQNGQDQYGMLMDQKNALNDPAGLEAKWSQGYSESPYAQQMTQKATNAGMDAASSMGLMGSSPAMNNIQQSAGDIMQSDRKQYMDDLMQKYMASVGIGQNMYNTGANAAGQMSHNAMGMGRDMAQNAYGQQNAPGARFGKLLGTAANAGMNYATGGICLLYTSPSPR